MKLDRASVINSRVLPGALLLAALSAFVATDPWFSILEDETAIVSAAREPVSVTFLQFVQGTGNHEHPPLSDMLLHEWLSVGGASQWALRLPSILLFLGALVLLAVAARKIAGQAAFLPVICIGVFSPYAFHFARLTGWYSWSFFLVAALTLAYLRFLERADAARICLFVVIALLLVYSNYYGWVVVGCLVFDACAIRRHPSAARLLLASLVVLGMAYTPLWPILGQLVADHLGSAGQRPILSFVALQLFHLYAAFVSESVAPWFWKASVPTSIAIAAIGVLTIRYLPRKDRAFPAYFMVLFIGLALLDALNTKRLLFISPWLILSIALALASVEPGRKQWALALSLLAPAAVGWWGIAARQYYAAPHFIEPWSELAVEASNFVRRGAPSSPTVCLSDST